MSYCGHTASWGPRTPHEWASSLHVCANERHLCGSGPATDAVKYSVRAWVQHGELAQETHEPEHENDGDRNTDQPEKTAFEHCFCLQLIVKTKRGGNTEVPAQATLRRHGDAKRNDSAQPKSLSWVEHRLSRREVRLGPRASGLQHFRANGCALPGRASSGAVH